MRYTLGFIGVGNMGGALVQAAAKALPFESIALCDKNTERAESLAKSCGQCVETPEELIQKSAFVVLGVKPYTLPSLLEEIAPALKENPKAVLVSMAAGVSLGSLQTMLTKLEDAPRGLIRIMPNTPCTLGEGVIQYVCDGVSEEEKEAFLQAFSQAGYLDEIDESKIDAASALSGCGPAFVYLFAEALADGAVACGLPRDKAILYAAKTLQGAGKMIEELGHLSDLKDSVCSPGGTTIAGVHALEKGVLRGTVMDAVIAAYKRTLELQ